MHSYDLRKKNPVDSIVLQYQVLMQGLLGFCCISFLVETHAPTWLLLYNQGVPDVSVSRQSLHSIGPLYVLCRDVLRLHCRQNKSCIHERHILDSDFINKLHEKYIHIYIYIK